MMKILFYIFLLIISKTEAQMRPENTEQFDDDVVVADAVFRGVYVGIVRLIQRISDGDSGYPTTTVVVRVKHKANDTTSVKHMWHVEHDPITGVNCAETNTHFAPLGITKQSNYTTYCSSYNPDYCEVGDISTKTTLTSLGKNVVNWYTVPYLPIVGPQTVVGHSVNIHGSDMSKKRQACANILLNERMTTAKIVQVNVKIQETLDMKLVEEARMRISNALGISISRVQTAGGLYKLSSGCNKLQFLIFGRGSFNEVTLSEIQEGKRSIGSLSPIGCTINGDTIGSKDVSSSSCDEIKQKNGNYNDWERRSDVLKPDDSDDDIIVADAVFQGVYVGIVRMTQKVTKNMNGYPVTTILVRVKHAINDSTSIKHMWHVEHDPINSTSCSVVNTHFAPFGITKEDNYTTYCSQNTPDYCEIGDISTKTTFTSIGKNVVTQYGVPMLPLVGPSTVIGHSVNIHGGDMSKVRQACANIVLNTRMTKAMVVDLPVKYPTKLNTEDLNIARIKMAKELGISLSKIHTAERLDMISTGCTKLRILIFDRGTYCPQALNDLKNGKIDIGTLSPIGCEIDRNSGATPKVPKNGVNAISLHKMTHLLAIVVTSSFVKFTLY